MLILIIVGILWLSSGYWEFSREDYVNDVFTQKADISTETIDLELLKKEIEPANEF